MILKKFTAIFTVLTLLFMLVPFNIITYANTAAEDTVVFDASGSGDIEHAISSSTANSYGSVTSDASNPLSGNNAVRINHEIVPSGKQFNAYMVKSAKTISDFTEYTYINYNIYSPEATSEKINFFLRNSGLASNKLWLADVVTDWVGWKTVSVPTSSFSKKGSITEKEIDYFIINIGGYAKPKAKAGYFLVDRIWLTDEIPAAASLQSSEYQDGDIAVPSDLGGDNAFSFTFDKNLANIDMSKAVKVEKLNGTTYADYSDYTVSVDGKKLDVSFAPTLTDGDTIKVTLNPNAVLSADYAVAASAAQEVEFTINAPTPRFVLESSSVSNGASVDSLQSLSLTFSTTLNDGLYVPEYVYIYRDGQKIYNSYTPSVSGKVLTLDFGTSLEAGHEYTVEISPDYADELGNIYQGESKLTFTLNAASAAPSKLVIFTAAQSDNFDILDTEYTQHTEITNLYSQTAKLEYPAGDTDLNAFITRRNDFNTSGMKYLNFLAYSPAETNNQAYIILYSDDKLVGNRYLLPIDWSGWKHISIPMSSLHSGTAYDGILINMNGWTLENETAGYILVDAVWFSQEASQELKLVSSSFPNGFESAALKSQMLTLEFNAELDASCVPNIVLSDGSSVVTDYTYSIEDKKLVITFGDLGLAGTSYVLSVDKLASTDFSVLDSPVTLGFTTASEGIFVNDISYSAKTVTAEVENLSPQSQDVTLVAYALSDDNVLLEKKQISVTAATGITNPSVTFSTSSDIKYVKAFVCDTAGNFISNKYLSVAGSSSEIIITSVLSGSSPYIENTDYNITVNTLELTTKLAGVYNGAVVELTSPSGDIISADVVCVSENGILKFYYVFSSAIPTGIYRANISSGSTSASKEIKYISKSDREQLLTLSNGSSNTSLAAFLKSVKRCLAVSHFTDAQLDDAAKYIIGLNPYADYSELSVFIGKLGDVISSINSSQWSRLPGLIDSNKELFSVADSALIAEFNSLSGTAAGAVSQILIDKLPAETISQFVSKLSEAVAQYNESLNNGTQTDGGYTGGGTGSIGGGSFSSAPTTPPTTNIPVQNNAVFIDLADTAWAADSILSLYESGVISAASDMRFRPNDYITREELVKMVVCAFVGVNTSSSHLFTDAVLNAWYNPYLATAYDCGIAKGYPDGRFGIGENITREDLVTICARTVESLGNSIPVSSDTSFTDSSAISAYAVQYVNAMVDLGVLSGMGDGTFAPKANATRAQAAKVVAKLMKLY